MKRILVGLWAMVVGIASATTINLDWIVDGNTYAQTTCESGGDLNLPTAPTKYGYTFRGWTLVDEIVAGTVTQNGTPTPSNPIYPTFYENNGMILRAVGNIVDTYNAMTGIITRRIGVKVLDGTELWTENSGDAPYVISIPDMLGPKTEDGYTVWTLNTHFIVIARSPSWSQYSNLCSTNTNRSDVQFRYMDNQSTLANFKQFLADQYANGTPVTIYYPLAEPVEEVWSGQ